MPRVKQLDVACGRHAAAFCGSCVSVHMRVRGRCTYVTYVGYGCVCGRGACGVAMASVG